MCEVKSLRPCVDIALEQNDVMRVNGASEARTLRLALSIDVFMNSFTLPENLVALEESAMANRMNSILNELKVRCSLQQLAAAGVENMCHIMAEIAELSKAVLVCVSGAYACVAPDADDLEGLARQVSASLPLWADHKRLDATFDSLLACYGASPHDCVDLQLINATLLAFSEACTVCGELLAAVSWISSPTTLGCWGMPQALQHWNSFSDTNKGSPMPPRLRTNSAPSAGVNGQHILGKDALKMAFESVSIAPAVRAKSNLLPTGLIAALDDSSSGSESMSSRGDGNVSPSYMPQSFIWRPNETQAKVHVEGRRNSNRSNKHSSPSHERERLQWATRPTGFRVVMCRHMDSKGKCKKADSCTFAHNAEDLEKFRALYIPTERCDYGPKCLYRNKNCQYSHTPSEQHRSILNYNRAVVQACGSPI